MNLSGPQAERDFLWQGGRRDSLQKQKEDLAITFPYTEKLVLRKIQIFHDHHAILIFADL
jgi:hypothetical protein